MGYSSRRPHRVPLLSDKNRRRRIQFTQAHQNWTIEDWKNVAWSDESGFLLQHSDGRVRIWRKEHESMDPSCLISTDQAGGGGVMVWGIFSWHTLGPLVPIEHHLNATAYLSIVADHVHPFITTVYPSSDVLPAGYCTISQSSNHLRLVSWTWQWVHFTQMASTVTRSQILYGVQVRRICWPIKPSNTMVIEPAFGSVGRCQVLLENEISISIKCDSRRKHEVN